MQFSFIGRAQEIKKISDKYFDLIIIGGGITGAGIALDAATRGLNVLLVEKYDFASGTSGKSTKLIHGGLRYLKQLEFGLVRQVGKERAVIYQLAPHLVHPINMMLPVYERGSLGKFSTALALGVYDMLADVSKDDSFYMLDKKKTLQAEPLLNENGLKGSAIYKEYRTDDARLTIAILKTASQFGAACFNYAMCNNFLEKDGKICGIQFTDLLTNESYYAKGSAIINAAGPWVDEVRSIEQKPEGKKLHLTKGVHLVVSKEKLPINQAVYFDTEKDKRMIFVIPRDELVYIGTTDTNYTGDKFLIPVSKEDVQYLLDAVHHKFTGIPILQDEILSSWAGLRPLIHEEGKNPGELSRKDEIFISPKGLISIAGGKLTGYRKMAEKTVDLVFNKIIQDKIFQKSSTKSIQLADANFQMPVSEYIDRKAGEASQICMSKNEVETLVNRYGTGTDHIIENAYQLRQVYSDEQHLSRTLCAEIQYCRDFEMMTNLSDFMIRRTGNLYFNQLLSSESNLDIICEIIQQQFQLSENEIQMQRSFYLELKKQSLSFKSEKEL